MGRREPYPLTSPEEPRLDPAVVAELYAEHADRLLAFLHGVLRDADAAAEVLQATFLRAIEAGQSAREESRKGWLFRVAFNEAMQIKRRNKVHDKAVRRLALESTDDAPEPQARLVRDEVVERVRRGLETLPPEQRQVVRMRIYEEMTFATIAEELGVPLGTVLTRMRLANQRLMRRLRDENR